MTLQEVIQQAATTRSCDQSDYIRRICRLLHSAESAEARDLFKEVFKVPEGFIAAILPLTTEEYKYVRYVEHHRPELEASVFDFTEESVNI